MSVWYAVPSARPPAESTLGEWKARGYKVAVWRDESAERGVCDMIRRGPYPGYAVAVNTLVRNVLAEDSDCEWIVTGGDDVLPDPHHSPEEIARECSDHFEINSGKCLHIAGGLYHSQIEGHHPEATFGVMQPTGDNWGDRQGSYVDRVCGSPWLGREFCLRINQGKGPLWPEYWHMGSDEELQAVSTNLGVLWQRPDLTHYHRHWGRTRKQASDMPEFLKRANSGTEWAAYKKLFAERQAAGFPGSEPL